MNVLPSDLRLNVAAGLDHARLEERPEKSRVGGVRPAAKFWRALLATGMAATQGVQGALCRGVEVEVHVEEASLGPPALQHHQEAQRYVTLRFISSLCIEFLTDLKK